MLNWLSYRPFVLAIGLFLAFPERSLSVEFSSRHHSYHAIKVLRGLNAPWSVEAAPDGTLFITERAGAIALVENGRIVKRLAGLPADLAVVGQGGLMDIALDPEFDTNKILYLCYSTKKNAAPQGGTNTRVSRFVLENSRLRDEKVLAQGGFGTDGAHFGCRLAFGHDGKLFATFGERHNKEKAQDLRYLNGKVIRIHSDGTIPRDNPFVSVPEALPEIYSLGHRNPQGLDIHPLSGVPVVSEHGPTGYDATLPGFGPVGKADEVNWLVPGGNFGWPVIFGNPGSLPWTREMKDAVASGAMRLPVKEFSVPDGIAPSGAAFYRGGQFPGWKHDFFVAALRGFLVRLKISPAGKLLEEEKIVPTGFGRFRDVASGMLGELWAINDSGDLIRIDRTGSIAPTPGALEESPLFAPAVETMKRHGCLDCHGFLGKEENIPAHWKGSSPMTSAIWRALASDRMPLGRPAMHPQEKAVVQAWLRSLGTD